MNRKTIMRRFFAIVLALTMCVSLLPVAAFADEQGSKEVFHEESAPEVTPEPTVAPAPAAVRVFFNCTPAETLVWVYDAADEDTELEPEEDGSFLLAPGDYVYVAFCEGYTGLYEDFIVGVEESRVEIEVVLQKNTRLEEAPIVAPSNANTISAWSLTKEYSSLLLDINWSNIQAVGHQISGSNACACYAMAYLFTILDGYTHYYSEYNMGTNEDDAWSPWNGNNYTAYFPGQKSDALEFMYSKLSSGVPVVAYVTGRGSSRHFVTVVGFENVSSSGSLSESNFLIIDPWSSSGAFVAENMGGVGYSLLAEDSYHVRYPTTGQSVTFSSTSFLPDEPYFKNFQSNYPITSGSQTEITFQWSDVGADQYYLDFATLQEDGTYKYWESSLGFSGTQSGTMPFSEGWYYVEVTAVNSAGRSSTNRAHFSVGNTAPEASAAVPVNQMEYNGHVYERYDYHMSWTEAKAYCETLGGYLAVLTSKEEENAVKSLLTGQRNAMYYLGFTDPSQSGNWQTVTGEAFTYSNWAANEPTKGAGEYYAALMARSYEGNGSEGYWIDNPDKELWGFYQYANAGFICEYDQKCTHDWDSGEITTAPTCTTGGEKTFTCNLCGETYTESVTALGHDYVETVIAGTCTQRPGTKYTCSRCDDSYTVWDEGGWSEWSTEYPDGYDEDDIEVKVQYRYRDKETTTSSSSTLEGWTLLSSEEVWGEYGSWSDWSRTYVAASDSTQVETAPLYRYYYFLCHGCGDHNPLSSACGCGSSSNSWVQRDSTIPYNQSNSSVVSYATYKRQTTSLGDGQLWYFSSGNLNDTAVGTVDSDSSETVINQGYRYRTRTQSTVYNFYRWGEWSEWSDTEVESSDTREVEMRGVYRYDLYANGQHSWDAGTVTIQPTCTTEGEKTFTCEACGETRTEAIPATGHTAVTDPAVAATCTTAGKTEGSHCSVCNAVIKAQTTIPATGHTAVKDPAVTATCTTAGKTEGSHCSVCNAVIKAQTTIPATGHTAVTDPAVAATCTTAGKTEGSHCSVCGEVIIAQTTIPATGHNFGEWVETKAPSLTEDGEETRTCQNPGCDVSETRAVAAVIYTISYDANGGTGAPAAQQKLKGTALTLSTTKPTYSGFTFKGWALSNTATTVDYAPGASYTADESVTLYAVWENDTPINGEFNGSAAQVDTNGNLLINEVNFPNEIFRSFISTTYDTSGTGYLTVSQVDAVTKLDCRDMGIADLKGVEYFTSLTHLICFGNKLTTLDVSKNTALILLMCEENQLKELDVSKNTALTELYCYSNQLTDLDVQSNTELKYLECQRNGLTELDVSANTALKVLRCNGNQLTTLDLSQNTALSALQCFSNQLTSLELSYNTNMSYLSCSRQTSTASAEWQGSDCIFDLGAMVGSENLDRVTDLTGGTYDSSTGIVTLDIEDGAATATVVYNYDHQSVKTGSIMDVTVNITVPEKPSCNHVIVTDPAVAATCTTAGKTEGSHCSVCGEVIVAQTTIPATGHNFGEWVETKAPSLTEDGEETRTCQNPGCDVSETRAVKAVIYTISYDANGGTGAPAAQQKLKGTALTLSTTKPTYSGFTFKGWALSNTATTVDYAPGASYTADESVTLYAVWEESIVVDENAPAIVVSSVNVRPGEEVDVTISLQNNPGIIGMTLKFEYDNTAMTLLSMTESGLEGIWQKNSGVTWASSTGDSTYNGVFLTLRFAVNADAAEGDYQVKVLYGEGDICNNDLEDVNFASVPGTVTVKNRIPGDVNGDEKVNTKDFVTLMKLLAGEDIDYVPGSTDINGDGNVNTKDFITLMKYLSGQDITIY